MEKKIDIWKDLAELVEDQLNLQVTMQFKHHHAFMLKNGLSKCKHITDLGTGNGTFLSVLAKTHPDISFTGMDSQTQMIEKACEKKYKNVDWVLGDVNTQETLFALRNSDGILMRYLLLHLKNTSAVISDLHQSITRGTKLWIIDLDLDHYICNPPHAAFDAIKNLVQQFCDENGKDSNIGSKLCRMLQEAGFSKIQQETEPLNTDTTDIKLLQKFILQEVMAYRAALQNTMTDQEFNKIKTFIDTLPQSGTYLNYGVTLVSATA